MASSKSEITRLLLKWKAGDEEAYNRLYSRIYDSLRNLAYAHMSNQPGHTLSKTELVHEVYIKMMKNPGADYKDRSHFLAVASRCMRQILIDYARKKKAEKRGGKKQELTYIDELYQAQAQKADELIGIDSALSRLAALNRRLSDVVEMRFFGEMRIQDIAEVLEISEATVKRDWAKARGWLYKELKQNFG